MKIAIVGQGRDGFRRVSGHWRSDRPTPGRGWCGLRSDLRFRGQQGSGDRRSGRSHGPKGCGDQADSADAGAIRAAVAQAIDRFGRLDIIVINAGILRLGSVETVTLEDLDRMLDVNVRGVFVAIQAAAPRLTDGGRVITIGSNTAVRTGFPGSSVYSMTKAAVASMVKGIALDLAPRAITVNNVQPGPIETDMTVDHLEMVKSLVPPWTRWPAA